MTVGRCFHCGKLIDSESQNYWDDFVCSRECAEHEDAAIAKGNRIIAEAMKLETEFKPIDQIRLDTQGPIGTALKGLNLRTPGDRIIKGIEQMLKQSEATQHVPQEPKHEIINEYDKSGNLGTD